MLAPAYWSGLVLIGDTAPVPIEKNKTPMWYVLLGLPVVLAAGYLYKRKRHRRSNTA